MASYVAWMDYSDQQRRRMMEVIDQFRERETRDELGLGTIRDALSDLLFPGTSTIQTRARYFLFVPWMYQRHEEKKTPSSEIAKRARTEELDLISVLAANPDHEGTIGQRAGRKLKRLPSSIYWNGLQQWGICRFNGSREEYHRSLDRFYTVSGSRARDDDGNPIGARLAANWDLHIPSSPDTFPTNAAFALARAEAEYLKEQVRIHAANTFLHFLVTHGQIWDPEQVPFPWAHPQVGQCPPSIQRIIREAQIFSELMLGAALLYNLLLARDAGSNEGTDEFTDALRGWHRDLTARDAALTSWTIGGFWALVTDEAKARVTELTRLFVEQWIQIALSPARRAGVASDLAAQKLIQNRERQLKGSLARIGNKQMLERWSGSSGAGQLDFRWREAQQICLDILRGLNGNA